MPVKLPRKLETEPEIHNGYRLLQPWTTKGAGTSMWSFAEKSGQEYFIKMFLKPVLPDPSSGMSPALIERKKKLCMEFEAKKRRVYDAVNASAQGNIVKIEDFFFDRTKYYLTTLRVEGSEIDPVQIAAMPHGRKMLFINVLAHSMMSLHKNGVVHGDLKPNNVLIKHKENGNFVAKLIDFGESFLASEPSGELAGDVYLSPEARQAMEGEPVSVDCKTDVFALGLIFHEYYTGQLPQFDAQYDYAHQALLNGAELRLHPVLKDVPILQDCIERMLRRIPDERPTIGQVFEKLRADTLKALTKPNAPDPPSELPSKHEDSGRLKISRGLDKGSLAPPPVPSDLFFAAKNL